MSGGGIEGFTRNQMRIPSSTHFVIQICYKCDKTQLISRDAHPYAGTPFVMSYRSILYKCLSWYLHGDTNVVLVR